MKPTVVLVLLFTAALATLALASEVASSSPCGVVFDGSRKGDADFQRAKDTIAAHWFDFEDSLERNRVLRYEWAVISEAMVTPTIKAGECRPVAGIRSVPDVLDWQSVGTHTSAKAAVDLTEGVTYFVLVRATTAHGRQVYANSDGVTITSSAPEPETAHHSEKRNHIQLSNGSPLIQNGLVVDFKGVCPINIANRCEQTKRTVGQFLQELYGPPEFNQNSQSTQIFRTIPPELLVLSSSSSSSSGPDGLNFGSIIGIAFGVMGFCLIASCLLVIVSSFKSKSDKFKTNINRREEMEEF